MIKLTLRPSVPDFGWLLDFHSSEVKPAATWYSEQHRQLVISETDMARLPREYISVIERYEDAMIAHITECEQNRYLTVLVCV